MSWAMQGNFLIHRPEINPCEEWTTPLSFWLRLFTGEYRLVRTDQCPRLREIVSCKWILAEYEECGCCTSYGHWRNEIHSIAAPMLLGKGMPLMLMCVSGPTVSLLPDV